MHQGAIENILEQGDGEYFYGYWTILIVAVMSIYTSVLAFEYNMLSFVAPCAVADFFPNANDGAAAYYEVWHQKAIIQPQLPNFAPHLICTPTPTPRHHFGRLFTWGTPVVILASGWQLNFKIKESQSNVFQLMRSGPFAQFRTSP